MSRYRRVAAACAALVALAGVVGTNAPAATASGVQLAVTPSAGLVTGQSVTVTASGLVPGDVVWPVEDCSRYCDRALAPSRVVDSTGSVTFSVTVQRHVWDSLMGSWSDPPLDCAYAPSCVIRLAHHDSNEDSGTGFVASQPIRFSTVPAAAPTMTIAAAQPLPAVVTTDVHGQGFTPAAPVYAARCFTHTFDSGVGDHCEAKTQGIADGSGAVTLSLELRQRTLGGDCLDPATVCTVRMWGGTTNPPAAVTVLIAFDPADAPPPPPVVTVTPSTGLGVAPTVSVHGVGFRPDQPVYVNQCAVAFVPWPRCAIDASLASTGVVARSRADGSFDASLPVQRYLTQLLQPVVDCAQPPGCEVVTSEDPDNPPAAVPLSFLGASDDPVLTFDPVVVTEGTSSDPTIARAHVHLDRASDVPVRFRWYPADGFTDLLGSTDLLEIPAGATAADLPVLVRADSMHEPDETAHLAVMAMEGAQIDPSTPSVPVRIRDDDPVPRVSVDDTIVLESDASGQATVHLHLSNPTQDPVIVRYRTRSGTAHAGRDYQWVKRVERLGRGPGDGASDRYLHIPLVDDHRRERLEYFDIQIRHARNAWIGHGRARVWIVDDD